MFKHFLFYLFYFIYLFIYFLSFGCVLCEKVWVKTSTALRSELTCFFWIILCWCHPRMHVMGKGLSKIFTTLKYFFLFSAASRKVYKDLLKLTRWVIFLPPSDVYVRSFICHYHFNKISTTQSSEWVRLSLVPELNLLLQRTQIRWNTISFHLSSRQLTGIPRQV